MDGAAGVPGFAAREFRIALFRRFPEDLLSLLLAAAAGGAGEGTPEVPFQDK